MALRTFEEITNDEQAPKWSGHVWDMVSQRDASDPITGAEMNAELNSISPSGDTRIRKAIHFLRKHGFPVASEGPQGRKGYFVARYQDEMVATLAHLRSRVRSIEEAIACCEAAQNRLPNR